VTRHIWIIGNNVTSLIAAIRLLPYGFHLHILEHPAPPKILDQVEVLPPVWPGFFHGTWSLVQEWSLPSLSSAFQPGSLEFLGPKKKRCPVPRVPFFSRLHLCPEVLFFKGLSWPDRMKLLNFLEKNWERHMPDEAVSDIQTAEAWVTAADQSDTGRKYFWNPLCRWLLGCDLPEASQRMFLAILTQYAQTTAIGTEWYFGNPSTMDQLKSGIRERLIKQGVEFHICDEYPLFKFGPEKNGTVSLTGKASSTADIYVATLAPEEILPLLPERALTKFSQMDQMAKIPQQTGSVMTLRIPDVRLPPSLVLGAPLIDCLTILPVEPSPSSGTYLTCLLQETPDQFSLKTHMQFEKIWPTLKSILPLPPNLPLHACNPELASHQPRVFPAIAGSRGFHPNSRSPISNLFFAGPWTTTSLPHSMESLVNSVNSCAEAIARWFFSGSR